MATPSRFELPISSLTGRRVRPLHHGAAKASSRHHATQTPRKQAATRVKDNAEWRPRQGVAGQFRSRAQIPIRDASLVYVIVHGFPGAHSFDTNRARTAETAILECACDQLSIKSRKSS